MNDKMKDENKKLKKPKKKVKTKPSKKKPIRKSNKRLLHILIRELVGIRNILSDMDFDELYAIDPDLLESFMSIDNLLEWGDFKYNFDTESKNWYKYPEYKDFMKYHAQLCYDCEEHDIDYYMVKNAIWDEYGVGDYYLCISCLEKRVGRELTAEDFTDCLANDDCKRVQEIRNSKYKVN